jgi:hemerythrin-like domain-containing protein
MTLVTIGRPQAEPAADLVGMLLACHERIRQFTAMAVRLAAATEASPTERAEAAIAVRRYFSVALPLHVRDEEESLAPRLLRSGLAGELARMAAQHARIERLLAELEPLWEETARNPAERELLDRQVAPARELEHLLASHLDLEEASILPAARRLLPAVQSTIAAEMRARRAA